MIQKEFKDNTINYSVKKKKKRGAMFKALVFSLFFFEFSVSHYLAVLFIQGIKLSTRQTIL